MQEQRINKYNKYVVAEDFLLVTNYNTVMELPGFLRAVINTTSKEYLTDKRQNIKALAACFLLSGQRGLPTRARKSIASFKLREGALMGCQTTLRKKKLYTVIDKFLIFALPRIYYERENNTFLRGGTLLSENKYSKIDPAAMEGLHFKRKKKYTGRLDNVKAPGFILPEELSQLGLHLTSLRKTHPMVRCSNSMLKGKTQAFKEQKHHLMFGIKNLPLIPELQEFLPLFDSIYGINLSVSFSNPRIKTTRHESSFSHNDLNCVETRNKITLPFVKGDASKIYDLLNHKKFVSSDLLNKRKGYTENRTCDKLHHKATRDPDVNRLTENVKRRLKKAKDTFPQEQKVEKERTLYNICMPTDTYLIKENRKILFLTCFQYPNQYN